MEQLNRRHFIQATAGGILTIHALSAFSADEVKEASGLFSPGCRKSKVKVGKLYIGVPSSHWPTPSMNIQDEMKSYESEFSRQESQLKDVEFVVNELISKPEQIAAIQDKLKDVDGILVIHLSIGVPEVLKNILALQKPTMLFAAPYSGHEWANFGSLRNTPEGELFDCILSSDRNQLAEAIHPIRAIHHLREAKILNITTRPPSPDYLKAVKEKFGTEVKVIGKEPILAAYESIPDKEATEEAGRWISGAQKIIEPSKEEIVKSCKLALAFQKVLDDEKATAMSADCYGTMYHQLPAFPCIGWVRLNNMGYGGICESDLRSALTHILFQGLCGKPGFISDPTVDESKKSIILAHCLGTTKMDGPDGESSPYQIRSIMEREEGAVVQSIMRVGQKVTQAILPDTNQLLYFTGEIIDTPDTPRGCRTKIDVKVDGDIQKLWQNWSNGLHRQTCYGDITTDLKRFCKFKKIKMINEA